MVLVSTLGLRHVEGHRRRATDDNLSVHEDSDRRKSCRLWRRLQRQQDRKSSARLPGLSMAVPSRCTPRFNHLDKFAWMATFSGAFTCCRRDASGGRTCDALAAPAAPALRPPGRQPPARAGTGAGPRRLCRR